MATHIKGLVPQAEVKVTHLEVVVSHVKTTVLQAEEIGPHIIVAGLWDQATHPEKMERDN